MSESDEEQRPKMERWRPKVAASKNKPPADKPTPPAQKPRPPMPEPPMPKPPKDADMPKPKPEPPISKNEPPMPDMQISPVSSECSSLETGESPRIDDVTIDIDYEGGRPWLGSDGILLEILKSIVYGGSMAVITSLSVVAFAAASDATTLSIISLALASLAGGFFFIRHNLWELRDDCYKFDNEAKYKELLGEVNYFPLHVFFTILSFVVFGMVPPVAYGYSFHETNDKDFTVVIVATASLVCLSLFAVFKAYINKCTFFEYIKTVAYHITTVVSVSSVSYVAGNLLTRFIEEYGLFDLNSSGGVSLLPHATIPSLAFV